MAIFGGGFKLAYRKIFRVSARRKILCAEVYRVRPAAHSRLKHLKIAGRRQYFTGFFVHSNISLDFFVLIYFIT